MFTREFYDCVDNDKCCVVHFLLDLFYSKTLRAFVIKNIFGTILMDSPVIQGKSRKKGSKKLRVRNFKS